jgi:oxaloacetate decarboxylase beta subunit
MSGWISLFQGIDTLFDANMMIVVGRLALIAIGVALVFLGNKGVLEPLLMIPMGLGMIAVNAGVLHLADGSLGTLFVDPLITDYGQLMDTLQVDFLQPVYTFTFSNGLIACLVFMGIGSILDIGYMMARPVQSMILALFAELGTVLVYPIGVGLGLAPGKAAAVALIGGADGPMVLYGSLTMAKDVFVPITVIAYLYLGLTYVGYPYLAKIMIPARLRGMPAMREEKPRKIPGPTARLAFTVVTCALLCLLFPVAAPLFVSLFVGVAVKEANLKPFVDFLSGPVLYGSTLFLGLLLGVLCEARVLLNPEVLPLLLLGILALLLSGIGGILGGYFLYFVSGRKYNPLIGMAGVSCVPTTAKLAQKEASKVNPGAIILPQALGANICGVITTAILCGIYTTLLAH